MGSTSDSTGRSKPRTAEMHRGPGWRLREHTERPDADVIAGLREFDTPAISDLMNRLYTMSPEISLMTDSNTGLVGPACTVKVFPGDNLMVHKALDLAREGDVIVIDAQGWQESVGVLGDLICMKARHRGIAGFIVDGLIRDLPAILALEGYPVFARGVTPLGPLHRGPGEINYPVSAGGVVVQPGDIIAADINGIVVLPASDAKEILEELRARQKAEAAYVAAVAEGDFTNEWADVILRDAGLPAPPYRPPVE